MSASKGKDLGAQANETLRAIVRRLVEDSDQTRVAEVLGLSQGYLSEFLSGKRGGGGRIVLGLAALDPRQLVVALGGIAPGTAKPTAGVELVAASILSKRGWTNDQIAAARDGVAATLPQGAGNALALANLWERALRGELVVLPADGSAIPAPEGAEPRQPAPTVPRRLSSRPAESAPGHEPPDR